LDYLLRLDLVEPGFWSYSADTTAEKQTEIRKRAVRFPKGIRIADVRQPPEARKTDGEVVIRFFRKGYVSPTVIRLVKDERTFTLVFNPFLQTVGVYEESVDFTFNEDDRAAGL
jgi:hypothetical protein